MLEELSDALVQTIGRLIPGTSQDKAARCGTKSRREARQPVRLMVELELPEGRIWGELLDLSERGAFFRPQVAFVTNKLEGDVTDDYVLDIVRVAGDVFDANTQAIVQWVGPSDQHASFGMGLQFLGKLGARDAGGERRLGVQ